jgi:predicted secreted protein
MSDTRPAPFTTLRRPPPGLVPAGRAPQPLRARGRANVVVAIALLMALGAASTARAQASAAGDGRTGAAPAPLGVVSLSASAVVELPRDLMTVVLSTSRDGSDPAAVQAGVRQALDAALAEARRVARPGQLDVQTGAFSLQPRYQSAGRIGGWIGSAELVVEGRDMAAISQLVGRIGTMTVSRVAYGLSREARERVESEATAQAVARFRARAADTAKLFGYAGYLVREVSVSGADATPPPMPMLRAAPMAAANVEAALPVEAGRGSVTITVNGTVQMTR